MKKLLIMASLFPPQKLGGGPITSVSNLVKKLKDKFEIYVLTHNYEIGHSEPLPNIDGGKWTTFDGVKVFYVDYKDNSVKFNLNRIKEVKPDVIYQNSFFSYDHLLASLRYKKKHKDVRVVVAPRGEFGFEKLKLGRIKKRLYIKALKLFGYLKGVFFQATSDGEVSEIENVIGGNKVFYATNLPYEYSAPDFVNDKKKGELSLFTISRIHEIKNILTSVKCLKKVSGKVVFDIYGPMEQIDYWAKCEAEIKELPENVTVEYKGAIDHDEVENVVRSHEALLFPTKGENFGQTIADSFLNARPVIISDKTPWSDCEEFGGGIVVKLEDEVGFTKAVQTFIDADPDEFYKYSVRSKEYIDKKLNIEEEVEKYCEMFGENE